MPWRCAEGTGFAPLPRFGSGIAWSLATQPMKAPPFTLSDAVVVALMTALFVLIAAAIHYSGVMRPGWSLF